MARKPAIKHIKNELKSRLDSSANLYAAVINFTSTETWEAIQGYEALHPGQAKKIISLAFLDMISQWEVFTENCFIRFLAGATYLNGKKPPLRITGCLSIEHSYQLLTLKEKYDPSNSYLSFTSWQQVEDKAKILFLNGEPFSTLTETEKQRLKDTIIIRNRIAHYSDKCRNQFKLLAKRFLNVNKLHSGFSVGDLLIKETDKHFSNNNMQSIFLHYYDLLSKLSDKITK
jgi:hypothetical protein